MDTRRAIEIESSADDGWSTQRCQLMPAALSGRLSELLKVLHEKAALPVANAESTVPLWYARGGATLFHEGAHAEYLYVIRSGTFKCFKTSEDGYEQVLGFAGQGEVLGFEALCRDHEPVSAVALEDATVFALPLRELDHWRQRFPPLDHALQVALSAQLSRAGEVSEMMAAVAAEVRLARFLVWLSARMAEHGQSPTRLRLRMNRRDIASLLGVAHETVSRSFSALSDWGLLSVCNREIEITDLPMLHACARSTRRLSDEAPHHGAGALHVPTPVLRPRAAAS